MGAAPLMLPNSATICYNNFVACVVTRSLLPSTVGQFMCRSIGAVSSVGGTKVLVLGPASTLFCVIDNPQQTTDNCTFVTKSTAHGACKCVLWCAWRLPSSAVGTCSQAWCQSDSQLEPAGGGTGVEACSVVGI